jgi:hypothetical protein
MDFPKAGGRYVRGPDGELVLVARTNWTPPKKKATRKKKAAVQEAPVTDDKEG